MDSGRKPLGAFALGMMNVVIVASLQIMTACAVYGSSLLLFYSVATLTFFLPCLYIIKQLVLSSPVTGGSYIWVERAFGKNLGFFAVCIQWLCNLIWYPTIFSLIATSFAYIVAPELAASKTYIFISMLALFWGITILNAFGIKVSSFASSLSAVIGVILPTLVLIALGISWALKPGHSQIHFTLSSMLPNLKDPSQFAFLTQIIISLTGLEMAFVHAGDVYEPKKSIPRALFISAFLILLIVIAAPLSIAVVIPSEEISVVAGLFDAFKMFFNHFHMPTSAYFIMFALIFIGNCGNVTAWMIGATRGMQVASIECKLPPFFQKTNKYNAPIGILILEALIFSVCAAAFLFFESISNAYWMLLTLACQISLLYYLFIFASAIKIQKKTNAPLKEARSIKIAALLGSLSILSAMTFGFFPPAQGAITSGRFYPFVIALGMTAILCIPVLLLKIRKKEQPEALENTRLS